MIVAKYREKPCGGDFSLHPQDLTLQAIKANAIPLPDRIWLQVFEESSPIKVQIAFYLAVLLTHNNPQRQNALDVYKRQPIDTINKYKGILPEKLLNMWEAMGLGIYENGFMQLVNPDEYEFVFEYIDKLLEPSIVFAITAMGDLLIWEGNKNWTIAPDEGNRVKQIDVRKCKSRVIGEIDFVFDILLGDDYGISGKKFFDSKPYLDIKDKLPTLEYGQCYGCLLYTSRCV